jgi:hypothetical protein
MNSGEQPSHHCRSPVGRLASNRSKISRCFTTLKTRATPAEPARAFSVHGRLAPDLVP